MISYPNGINTVEEIPDHKSYDIACIYPTVFTSSDILHELTQGEAWRSSD